MELRRSHPTAWVLLSALLAASPGLAGDDDRPAAPGTGSMPPGPPSPALVGGADEAKAQAPRPVLERDDLVRRVLERNPEIRSARAAWSAARARVPQARALDHPMASAHVAPLSVADSGVRTGTSFQLSQRIPYPGRRDLRAEVAAAEAEIAEEDIEAVRLRLATTAALLWDEYWLTHRLLEINEEHIELLETFREIATRRYGAGLVAQQAPLKAEVEATHVLHRHHVLETERSVLVARINALLHRGAGEPLPSPAPLPSVTSSEPTPPVDVERALARRPELVALAARQEARSVAVELAELEARPDFEVTTGFTTMRPLTDHRWTVGIGVRIPLWRERIRASVEAAEAELESSHHQLDRAADRVREEIAVARERVDEAVAIVELYEDRVLPAVRDQVRAARSGFETGVSGMLELIDAERSLRVSQVEHSRARAAVSTSRTRLRQALGMLPAGPEAGDVDDGAENDERAREVPR